MTTPAEALLVKCPLCWAAPGAPCVGKAGYIRRSLHAGRFDVAVDPPRPRVPAFVPDTAELTAADREAARLAFAAWRRRNR